jgi:hypothetical protein
MEVSGQLHALAALTPGKQPQYTSDRRLHETQSQSGPNGKESKFIQSIVGHYIWATLVLPICVLLRSTIERRTADFM